MTSISAKIAMRMKEFLFKEPWRRYCFPMYSYQYSARQLVFLCQCVEETSSLLGNIAEIGCERGHTTIFLNNFMSTEGIDKKYFALDTFSGFVREDVEFEVAKRSKRSFMYTGFKVNKKKWFDGTMEQNNIGRVTSIEADVNHFDLTDLGPIAFAILDVDLYRPIKKALPELYSVLNPGGIIVVDDCDKSNPSWDGSYQAYQEFVAMHELPSDIVYRKLGVIRKPTQEIESSATSTQRVGTG